MLNFFLTVSSIEVVLSDLNRIIHSIHLGAFPSFGLQKQTIEWLVNHYSNQDKNNFFAQSHNIISLITLLKTSTFVDSHFRRCRKTS